MQYKVYTDKQENFICEINLTGASLTNAKSRIIVSSDVVNIMFEGKVDSSGKCTVPIKKLQGLLPEGTTGDIKFIVEASKKITVEVKSQSQEVIQESKPKMEVIVETDKKTHVVNILREIKKQKITLKNIDQKRDDLTEIITNYQSSFTLTEQEKSYIISKVLKALEKFS